MKNIKIIILSLLAILVLFPRAYGATVSLESSRDKVAVGDTVIITLKISAEGQVINTIDGNISIDTSKGKGLVKEFSLANSVFGMWPRTASLSPDGKTISFVGGVPGGMSIENATVFNFAFQADKEGVVNFGLKDILVFLNDNKGTTANVKTKNLSLNVVSKSESMSKNDWVDKVSNDKIPPEKFIIILGQDKKVYDGKIFAFFSAVDNQSGIDHYEVMENGSKPIRTGSVYVLSDQSDRVKLKVLAFDKAGNSTASYYPNYTKPVAWGWVIVIVLGVYIIVKVYKNRKNKRNNEAQF